MKKIRFYKFQATGNDFIMIDNRDSSFIEDTTIIANLCDRRFGIGADGLILLEDSSDDSFKMKYFNSDGNEGSMCGNGGRAFSSFIHHLKISASDLNIDAFDGIHHAKIRNAGLNRWIINLGMSDVEKAAFIGNGIQIDTGSPHHMVFVEDAEAINVYDEGKKIRYSDLYPQGTNVNFVQKTEDGVIVRTYERGVEDETLSCGTGVTASAISIHLDSDDGEYNVPVFTRGGNLEVYFKKSGDNFSDIILEGPANFVFEGVYYL